MPDSTSTADKKRPADSAQAIIVDKKMRPSNNEAVTALVRALIRQIEEQKACSKNKQEFLVAVSSGIRFAAASIASNSGLTISPCELLEMLLQQEDCLSQEQAVAIQKRWHKMDQALTWIEANEKLQATTKHANHHPIQHHQQCFVQVFHEFDNGRLFHQLWPFLGVNDATTLSMTCKHLETVVDDLRRGPRLKFLHEKKYPATIGTKRIRETSPDTHQMWDVLSITEHEEELQFHFKDTHGPNVTAKICLVNNGGTEYDHTGLEVSMSSKGEQLLEFDWRSDRFGSHDFTMKLFTIADDEIFLAKHLSMEDGDMLMDYMEYMYQCLKKIEHYPAAKKNDRRYPTADHFMRKFPSFFYRFFSSDWSISEDNARDFVPYPAEQSWNLLKDISGDNTYPLSYSIVGELGTASVSSGLEPHYIPEFQYGQDSQQPVMEKRWPVEGTNANDAEDTGDN